jgi:hypothetical protein
MLNSVVDVVRPPRRILAIELPCSSSTFASLLLIAEQTAPVKTQQHKIALELDVVSTKGYCTETGGTLHGKPSHFVDISRKK